MAKVKYEDEEWKDIPGFENSYAVSNYGRVKNIKKNTLRKSTLCSNGYFAISLWNKEKKERIPLAIHRLVATLFVAGSGECVNHIDGNKLNNHFSNLEWCSLAENTEHAYKEKLINNHTSIEIIETGMKFKKIKDCVEWLKNNGFPKARHGNIVSVIKGNRHNAYGYTYRYIPKII